MSEPFGRRDWSVTPDLQQPPVATRGPHRPLHGNSLRGRGTTGVVVAIGSFVQVFLLPFSDLVTPMFWHMVSPLGTSFLSPGRGMRQHDCVSPLGSELKPGLHLTGPALGSSLSVFSTSCLRMGTIDVLEAFRGGWQSVPAWHHSPPECNRRLKT